VDEKQVRATIFNCPSKFLKLLSFLTITRCFIKTNKGIALNIYINEVFANRIENEETANTIRKK
jgi:hypothetical protein